MVGLLTVTFTTPQASRTDEREDMFDAMAATAELGWRPNRPDGYRLCDDPGVNGGSP